MRPAPLRRLGNFLQANSAIILLLLSVGLLVLCVAIKSVRLDAELDSWIERTPRVDAELNYASATRGEATGSTSVLLLQAPRQQDANVLTVDSLMIHLEALAIATHVTVDLYDVSWTLKDLCYMPTPPDFEGAHVGLALDNMMPCVIKTPLTCFWEGAKLLGPEQPVQISVIDPIRKWTSLNPMFMVKEWQRNHPHASFPYEALIDWMRRVGITDGYQFKPCLDPTDPNCPDTAPNKVSRRAPDIGARLTGGCRGIAVNQMHWKEEEIVGGVTRNKSGHIVRASALQSIIQLMGEQDMYDYWRKTSKVQDVNNWSAEKAKVVLDAWQQRYKEELAQFTRTSSSSSAHKIHAMTSKSMLEPIDYHSLLDLTIIQLCFVLMTLFTFVAFPRFDQPINRSNSTSDDRKLPLDESPAPDKEVIIGHLKRFLLAIVTSLFVSLTFIASLGLSSFMNLPFNMATTQILPPWALYYGFQQFLMVANIYSQKFGRVPLVNLTTECLDELFPIVTISSLSSIAALLVAAIIPVSATRVLAFQALAYVVLATLAAIVLMPAFMTTFLLYFSPESDNPPSYQESSKTTPARSGRCSPGKFSLCSKKGATKLTKSEDINMEDRIFSRIQDDLKNIQADACHPTDINFSAHLGADGLRTSFKLTTSRSSRHSGSPAQTISSFSSSKSEHDSKRDIKPDKNDQFLDPSLLPDLLACALPKEPNMQAFEAGVESNNGEDKSVKLESACDTPQRIVKGDPLLFRIYADSLVSNKFVQFTLFLIALCIFAAMVSHVPKVKYGLQLRDIVARGTPEYESFFIQEKYFPVYNVYAVTKGNFEYASNQRLLHEFYKTLQWADGVVRDEDTDGPKFWLVAFRDWLQEIQDKFDIARNNSAISAEGWTPDASDAAKLAYKLLAQTGRADNPVDKSIVESNRLVDTNGIINPKAFYYYLSAWVMNDPFTYANSEAMFKPEPKVWNGNPNDLKIEKARPLVYTQIPFIMKLPANHDSLKTISEFRRISQAFEQLNLPNFPTGVPFIFWDQFFNLDLLMLISTSIGITSLFIVIVLKTSDISIAAITTIPITITMLELYGFMGYMSIPFNNILAVLLTSTMGFLTVPTIHYVTYFKAKDGDLITRTREALQYRSRIVITNLLLFSICVIVFNFSRIDFMIKYSYLLCCLAILNSFNSLLLTPILLSKFGSVNDPPSPIKDDGNQTTKSTRSVFRRPVKSKNRIQGKKRSFPIVQSEISLSTISEEPQSEAHVHDLKFDFSIRCY